MFVISQDMVIITSAVHVRTLSSMSQFLHVITRCSLKLEKAVWEQGEVKGLACKRSMHWANVPFSVEISSLKTRLLGNLDGPCGKFEGSHLLVYWISSRMVSEESRGKQRRLPGGVSLIKYQSFLLWVLYTLSPSSPCAHLWTHFLHWWGQIMEETKSNL